MKKNTQYTRMILSAAVCAVMALNGSAVAYGQNAPAAKDESFVKTVEYTSESLRDPFEGYIRREAVTLSAAQLAEEENFVQPVLLISGITWGSSFPQAIVNGKVVKAGDLVDEAQVVSISKEGIIFLYKNQQFSLPAPGANSGAQSDSKTP